MDTGDGARTRVFGLKYPIPKDGDSHRIRIDVTDQDGTRTVYDEPHNGGETVKTEVQGVGKPTIRLYDNDAMRYEKTL